jgi:CRISPR-associated protein Cas1
MIKVGGRSVRDQRGISDDVLVPMMPDDLTSENTEPIDSAKVSEVARATRTSAIGAGKPTGDYDGIGAEGSLSEKDMSGISGNATSAGFSFDFTNRNRRPPRDPVNALLSLAYSMLAKDLTVAAYAVGFDPMLGYFHQLRPGRAALALDLMEPFRPLIADSAVLSAINTRMVTPDDFVRAGNAVSLTATGRKKFYQAYEQRMDSLVTHPMFGYRANYRRILEIQVRLLARVLTGELTTYPVFVTR